MASEVLVQGTLLGIAKNAYDFVDEGGERRAGTSVKLKLLCGMEVQDIKVPDDRIADAETLVGMYLNQEVQVLASVPKGIALRFVSAAA